MEITLPTSRTMLHTLAPKQLDSIPSAQGMEQSLEEPLLHIQVSISTQTLQYTTSLLMVSTAQSVQLLPHQSHALPDLDQD